ncbi:MAG: uroporphyrinogen-III C-methyltransferase [Burkholderiales bacterium]
MKGKVYLVGAGPGDPELMTLRAARLLREADVVLADDLVSQECFRGIAARVVRVGKRAGCKSTPQGFIERLAIWLARRGNVVVRLKGGDPCVFGRGGEELAAMRAAGIEVAVVPGITAGLGVPAELGIAATLRGVARGITLLDGHSAAHDWCALRASGMTLAIYMGLARLPELVAAMLLGGFAPATPACAVQDGTLPSRRQVLAPLGLLPATVAQHALRTPALIVVGEVVRTAMQDEQATLRARAVAVSAS